MNKIIKGQLPVIDILKCTNCDLCLSICPLHAIIKASSFACAKCIKYCISMNVPCNNQGYVFCYEKCDNCGLCITACENGAINWFKLLTIN
jgi:Pyruvate/2-oxoacid:ferredoxin oxidoreductase delta subunit